MLRTNPVSRLYECRVLHERFHPKPHRFAYRVFYLALDLDELAHFDQTVPIFSVNRRNLVSIFENDYLQIDGPLHNDTSAIAASSAPAAPRASLKDRARRFCARHGVDLGAEAKITLVTLPRLFGYTFNPISLFICRDAAGTPLCAIAEVTNTYREVKHYHLPLRARAVGPAEFGARVPKHFYVSPFSALDAVFDFSVREPGSHLAVRIDDYEQRRRTLHSTLTGTANPLTTAALAGAVLRHPLVTLRVITLIHWQALRLWLKGVPHFPKAERPDLQRSVRRPHASLIRRSPA